MERTQPDPVTALIRDRLDGKRALPDEELAPCAAESAAIGADVAGFRNRLSPGCGPFDFELGSRRK